jgi:hypothetical protein
VPEDKMNRKEKVKLFARIFWENLRDRKAGGI